MKNDVNRSKPKPPESPSAPPIAPAAGDAVPFELTFVSGYDAGDTAVEAELTSPLLDPSMQSDGVLRVNVHTASSGKKGKPRFLLDAFHVSSLIEFLRSQRHVRATFEAELARDRENWSTRKKSGGGDIWRSVKVLSLDLVRRRLPSPQFLERMKERMEPERYAAFVAAQDTPETRTVFILVLDCKWDGEHQVKLEFRDGRFRGLSHE